MNTNICLVILVINLFNCAILQIVLITNQFFLTDMIRRKTLRTRNIKTLVLDEADEMLNKGFKEQIYDVYRFLPPATQV